MIIVVGGDRDGRVYTLYMRYAQSFRHLIFMSSNSRFLTSANSIYITYSTRQHHTNDDDNGIPSLCKGAFIVMSYDYYCSSERIIFLCHSFTACECESENPTVGTVKGRKWEIEMFALNSCGVSKRTIWQNVHIEATTVFRMGANTLPRVSTSKWKLLHHFYSIWWLRHLWASVAIGRPLYISHRYCCCCCCCWIFILC